MPSLPFKNISGSFSCNFCKNGFVFFALSLFFATYSSPSSSSEPSSSSSSSDLVAFFFVGALPRMLFIELPPSFVPSSSISMPTMSSSSSSSTSIPTISNSDESDSSDLSLIILAIDSIGVFGLISVSSFSSSSNFLGESSVGLKLNASTRLISIGFSSTNLRGFPVSVETPDSAEHFLIKLLSFHIRIMLSKYADRVSKYPIFVISFV